MRQEAERLRQTPGREGVGAETRMHQCQATREVGLGQVGEIVAELHRLQHTFIYNVAGGERSHIEIGLAGDFALGHLLLDAFANQIELQLQLLLVVASRDEDLFDVRLRGQGILAQDRRVDRHLAQVHQGQALLLDLLQHDAQDGRLLRLLLGKENQSGAILSLLRDGDSLQQDKLMGNLHHDSRAITCLVIGALCATVTHIFQHSQGRFNNVVRLLAVDVDDHTYTTSVMLIGRIVQSLFAVKMIFLCPHLLTFCLCKNYLFVILVSKSRNLYHYDSYCFMVNLEKSKRMVE